jgi:hypothetical protein
MNRREFLIDTARTLLVLPFGTFLLVQCKEDDPPNPYAGDDTPPDAPPRTQGSNVFYTSSKVEEHSHAFTVPVSSFEAPPMGGMVGKTTAEQGHSHKVEISEEGLRRAGTGEIIKVPTSEEKEHTHMFTLVKVG